MQTFICNYCGNFNQSKSLICTFCLKINIVDTGDDSLSFSLEKTLSNLSLTQEIPRKGPKTETNIKEIDFLINHNIADTNDLLQDIFTPLPKRSQETIKTKSESTNSTTKCVFSISSKADEFLRYFIPNFEDNNWEINLIEQPSYIVDPNAFSLIFSFPNNNKKEFIVSYYGQNIDTLNIQTQLNHTNNLTYIFLTPLPEKTIKTLYTYYIKYKGRFRFMVFKNKSEVLIYFCNILKKVKAGFNFKEENLKLELLKTIKTQKIKMNVFDILNKNKNELNKTEKEELKIKNSFFKMLNQVEGINEARAKVIFSQFNSFRKLMDFFYENKKENSIIKIGNLRIGNTEYSKRIGNAQAEKLYDYFN